LRIALTLFFLCGCGKGITQPSPFIRVILPSSGTGLYVAGQPVTIQWQKSHNIEWVNIERNRHDQSVTGTLIFNRVPGNKVIWRWWLDSRVVSGVYSVRVWSQSPQAAGSSAVFTLCRTKSSCL
jgi:hypothetical protein